MPITNLEIETRLNILENRQAKMIAQIRALKRIVAHVVSAEIDNLGQGTSESPLDSAREEIRNFPADP